MKAMIKCHASLPIDILFCASDRTDRDGLANAWAPSSPQGRRLDETFGSMKVFTDCLYISSETSSKYLQICVGKSRDLMANRFEIDVPIIGRVWVETDKSIPDQHRDLQDRTICLMFPNLGADSKASIWSESLGARFIVQKQEGKDLHMIYDCPFRMYSYDRGAVQSSIDGCASDIYPYVPIQLVEPQSRIFIRCGKLILLIYLHLH